MCKARGGCVGTHEAMRRGHQGGGREGSQSGSEEGSVCLLRSAHLSHDGQADEADGGWGASVAAGRHRKEARVRREGSAWKTRTLGSMEASQCGDRRLTINRFDRMHGIGLYENMKANSASYLALGLGKQSKGWRKADRTSRKQPSSKLRCGRPGCAGQRQRRTLREPRKDSLIGPPHEHWLPAPTEPGCEIRTRSWALWQLRRQPSRHEPSPSCQRTNKQTKLGSAINPSRRVPEILNGYAVIYFGNE